MIDLSYFIGALVAGLVYALINIALHVMGPRVPWPEEEARPLYYGIGFTAFLVVGWAWAVQNGAVAPMLALTIIGGCGGMGMLTAYVWDGYQARRDTTQVDTLAEGPHHELD